MARGPVLLQLSGVRLSRGGAPLFDGADLALHKGERACLVGANGAGKSTLLAIAAGLQEPDEGARSVAQGVEIAMLPQEPDLEGWRTLGAYVENGGAVAPHRAAAALEDLALSPERACDGLSGGEARRAALARAFALDPDILLLDEPTNHLDIAAISALEARLCAFRGALLLISHDRRFLETVSTSSFWLRKRRLAKLDRGFAAFEAWAEAIEIEEERAFARLETHLKAEEHWLQRGVTARRSRNEGRRRRLETMRSERRAAKGLAAGHPAAIAAEKGRDTGALVVEARGLCKTWPGQPAPAVRDLDLRLMRGDRLGIVGPNGAGKTTLLDLLLGRTPPDAGTVRQGANLEIAHIDQTRALLVPEATVQQALCPLGGDQVLVRGRPVHVAAYARSFLFSPGQLRQPVAALSGGERNRLALAVVLAKPANLLVLDEPTNDLDMETLDALEEALAAYDGAVIVVSHDRAFLDGVTTQVLGSLGGGKWAESPGGYADFVREHGAPGGKASPAPPPPTRRPEPARDAERRVTKLSYKDERRLAELEARLPELAAGIKTLEARLADPAFFGRDPGAFAAAAADLDRTRDALASAEDEWLALEALKESLKDG
jgi:ATP-binding cassette subfamily F protein uup